MEVRCKILATGEIKKLSKFHGVYVEFFYPNGIPEIAYSKTQVKVLE